MKKVLRFGLKSLLWILGIIVVLWVGLLVYVSLNEEKLISTISTAITQKTRGETKIESVSVSLFRTFPIVSLQLEEIVLRDSLYSRHHQDLLKASDIYLKLSLLALVKGEPALGRVIVRNGSINLIVDSAGYSNLYVLKSDKKRDTGSGKPSSPPDIVLQNILFTHVNAAKRKFYQGQINDLVCSVKDGERESVLKIDTKIQIRHLEFDTRKGSFARDKPVRGKIILVLDKTNKNLVLNNVKLDIDDHRYTFNGFFETERESPEFRLQINTRKLLYDSGLAVVNDHIRQKLNKYSISEPMDIDVIIEGQTVFKSEPRVELRATVAGSEINAPQGAFTNCGFKAFFTNEMEKGKERVNKNSLLQFTDFSATWSGIPFKSREVRISNFDTPQLECDIRSEVDMKTINNVSGSTTFQFQKGKTLINVKYKGPVDANAPGAPNINGEVKIIGAEVKYLPRNFLMSDFNGSLVFEGRNLSVDKVTAMIGKTPIQITGYANNFLTMLITSPEKLETKWNINSREIRLEDFTTFLTPVNEGKKTPTPKKGEFSKASDRIDKVFREGNVFVSLSAPLMTYKKFRATNVKGGVVLKKSMLELQNAHFNHAGGSMDITGTLENKPADNPLTLQTRMTNMNIPLLFAAFDNFGQDAITDKNLKGTLSANINLTSSISDKAKMVTSSSRGTIDFLLQNGELNHFEPILKVGEKVFKKQNFEEISFADLKNRLELKGTTFIINQMEIRSTAMTLFVEGVYDVKTGTDMSIRLPVRNLTRNQEGTDLSEGGKNKKGLSLRLRARTGDDGKLKLSWDPFKRSVQNKEAVRNSKRKNK